MQHKGTVRLETGRLILRPFALEDAEAAFRNWMSDSRTTEFLRWPTHTSMEQSLDIIRSWIESGKDPAFYQWAIELKEISQPIGSISVVEMDEAVQKVHIGYCIGSAWWNRGYTSEAFSEVIRFLFDEVGAQRIEAQHDPHNPASGRVMEKCGLRYEGTLRGADWNNKGIVDACMYGLLAKDRR